MEIQDINKALDLLMGMEPLIDFEDPGPMKAEQYASLALLYTNEGFRSYLIRSYNSSLKDAALRSKTETDMAFGKAKALVYKKILVDAKRAFEHIEQLRKLKENPQTNA